MKYCNIITKIDEKSNKTSEESNYYENVSQELCLLHDLEMV